MKRHLDWCTIYAVDFDGTLCKDIFPDIGEPNETLIEYLIKCKKNGDKIILWTNRVGEHLERAIKWCTERGLVFDAVNDNIPEVMEKYKDILKGQPASRKITADVFIDDAACNSGLPFKDPGCSVEKCWRPYCPIRKPYQMAYKEDLPESN